jgi:hypothetical protein
MITTIRSCGQGSAQIFNDKLAETLFCFQTILTQVLQKSLRMAKKLLCNNSASKVIFSLAIQH